VTWKQCCTCFKWHLCQHKTVYRHEIRALEPGKGWVKHILSSGNPSYRLQAANGVRETYNIVYDIVYDIVFDIAYNVFVKIFL
jgi:hypothetical protein